MSAAAEEDVELSTWGGYVSKKPIILNLELPENFRTSCFSNCQTLFVHVATVNLEVRT